LQSLPQIKMRLTLSRMSTFRALVSMGKNVPATVQSLNESQLPATSSVKAAPGDCDTIIKVDYSNLNFKDAMVATGSYPGLQFPMVGGIDLVGRVMSTTNPHLKKGDEVLINGFGMGTDHWGGFAEKASVPGYWCLPLLYAGGVSPMDAARIGTAGYTAMLCVEALTEKVKPDDGPIVVTGATGGVGSIAVSLLSNLGYHVTAVTGKENEETWQYLKKLGAKDILDRSTMSDDPKPLGRTNYAGAVDTVGGNVLANVISELKYGGTAAICGMAGQMGLPTSVAPFILRGVSLLGIDSVYQPMERRKRVYQKYVPTLVDKKTLETIAGDQLIKLESLPAVAARMLKGETKGRYVVAM